MRKASEFLRKLSLNAEKNWHQNSGAKRRVVISDVDIDLWPVWMVGLRTSLIARDTTRPWLWPKVRPFGRKVKALGQAPGPYCNRLSGLIKRAAPCRP